jgi:hypothetical protein
MKPPGNTGTIGITRTENPPFTFKYTLIPPKSLIRKAADALEN